MELRREWDSFPLRSFTVPRVTKTVWASRVVFEQKPMDKSNQDADLTLRQWATKFKDRVAWDLSAGRSWRRLIELGFSQEIGKPKQARTLTGGA
jgi:hypothetical protein